MGRRIRQKCRCVNKGWIGWMEVLPRREHTLDKFLRHSDKVKCPDGRKRQEIASQSREWNILGNGKEKKKHLALLEGDFFFLVVLSCWIYTCCYDTNNMKAMCRGQGRKLTVPINPYLRRSKKWKPEENLAVRSWFCFPRMGWKTSTVITVLLREQSFFGTCHVAMSSSISHINVFPNS